jgi:hypothetical protein
METARQPEPKSFVHGKCETKCSARPRAAIHQADRRRGMCRTETRICLVESRSRMETDTGLSVSDWKSTTQAKGTPNSSKRAYFLPMEALYNSQCVIEKRIANPVSSILADKLLSAQRSAAPTSWTAKDDERPSSCT